MSRSLMAAIGVAALLFGLLFVLIVRYAGTGTGKATGTVEGVIVEHYRQNCQTTRHNVEVKVERSGVKQGNGKMSTWYQVRYQVQDSAGAWIRPEDRFMFMDGRIVVWDNGENGRHYDYGR